MAHQNLALAAVPALFMSACSGTLPGGIGDLAASASGATNTKPTDDEAIGGLKDALIVGITKGAQIAAQVDGYWGNAEIRIPFPEDFVYVADKVRQLGLGNVVDDFVRQLNRGAERAATKAVPIFKNAITSMTIADAWGILRGGDSAATLYLQRTTSAQLEAAFKPVIRVALDEVNATRYYNQIITAYNRIPLTKDVNPDLDDYAAQAAINGLFVLVAQQEAKIRLDPIARTTELLKKVFDYISKNT